MQNENNTEYNINSMSLYQDHYSVKKNQDISIRNYIDIVKLGGEKNKVLKGRDFDLSITQEKELYKKIKLSSKCVTSSALMDNEGKSISNIVELNGYIVLDVDHEIDNNTLERINNDNYVFISHRSFGGQGMCIFVKIDKDKFKVSFDQLGEYFFKTHNVTIDPSCGNPNKLRALSYDPDLYFNSKSKKFTAKEVKKPKKQPDYSFIYTKSDFDSILYQIKQNRTDLCQGSYDRYFRIGFSLYDKFGDQGKEYLKLICSFGDKYSDKRINVDWKYFKKSGNTKIGTLYHYCKEAGLKIYSDKTIAIVNSVRTGKAQGNPTVDSISKNLQVSNNITADESDRELIQDLIDSPLDFHKNLNSEKSKIKQLEDFIMNIYSPVRDTLVETISIKDNQYLGDEEVNDIYISANDYFDFSVNIKDVYSILYSNSVKKINPFQDFLELNENNPVGLIDKAAMCFHPQSEYNKWVFKRWIVGAVHNWVSDINDPTVSPLTLVLSGEKGGTGKTSFFRKLLPESLICYLTEGKIDSKNKDSKLRMAKSLLMLDDEFGGKTFQNINDYKALSDTNIITERVPYGRIDKRFKRRAALCATTNETDILKDPRDNRRILIINVEDVDHSTFAEIDKNLLIIEAYNLLKSGFDWVIRHQKDIDYLSGNNTENKNINPAEEVFFKHFNLENTDQFCYEFILNQGDILELLTARSLLKITKYDLRDIFIKNKLTYKTERLNSGSYKKGVKLYSKEKYI